jgi:DNA-binding NarL/FixJ family response regulator
MELSNCDLHPCYLHPSGGREQSLQRHVARPGRRASYREGVTQGDVAGAVRVLIIDDDRLNRECLAAQLALNGLDVDCAWDLPSLFSATDDGKPDIVLLNIRTDDSATLLQVSLDMDVDVRVVIFGLAADRDSEILTCAEAGVAGLHLRSESLEHLLTLLRDVGGGQALCSPEVSAILLRRVYASAGQPDPEPKAGLLTAREAEILGLIDEGLTNQQIASRLTLTVNTVKNHVHNLLTKLGVGSRAEAAAVGRAGRYANPDSVQQAG